MKKTVQTGFRLTPAQATKLLALADDLGVKRNQAIGLLIDHAEIERRPVINVQAIKNNRNTRVSTASVAVGE